MHIIQYSLLSEYNISKFKFLNKIKKHFNNIMCDNRLISKIYFYVQYIQNHCILTLN